MRRADYLRSIGFFKGALSAMDEALAIVKDDSKRLTLESKRNIIVGEREKAQIEQDRRMTTATKEERKAIMLQRRLEAKSTQNYIHLLSDDILLMITDHLLVENPSIGCRLSAVCTEWRDVMYDRPYVWSNLVLGGTRPVRKAEKFMERSQGNIKKLKLLPSFKSDHEARVSELIKPHIGGLECFEFASRPHTLIDNLKGLFDSLRELWDNAKAPDIFSEPDARRPDRGLALTKATLRKLDIKEGIINFGRDVNQDREPQRVSADSGDHDTVQQPVHRVDAYLSNLKQLKLHMVEVFSPRDVMRYLHQYTPMLEEAEFDMCHWHHLHHLDAQRDAEPDLTHKESQERLTMKNLKRFSENPLLPGKRFDIIHAPNLVHLELSANVTNNRFVPVPNTISIVTQLKAVGLADTLPNLESLDISGNTIGSSINYSGDDEIGDLIDLLRDLKSLQFLNGSWTTLGDNLLQALTWPKHSGMQDSRDSTDLLPELVGLSVAGLEITSIALRDFVMSRLPKSKQVVPQIASSRAPTRSSFMPSGSSSRSQNAARVPLSQEARSTQTEATHPSVSNQVPSTRKGRFKWLCLDHVMTVDPQLSVYLESKIPFVSHSLRDRRVIERMKGKGRYRWDLEYYHSCADPAADKCRVQRVQGKSLPSSRRCLRLIGKVPPTSTN